MGAGIVLIFLLILAGVYGFVFLAFAGLWFWGRRKKATWLKWIGGIPAVVMLAFAVFVAGFFAWGISRTKNPEWVFKETFNIPPPAAVTNLQSSYYYFADTGSVYLRFQTTEAEFQKLVNTKLVKKTSQEMQLDAPTELGGERPVWWDYQIQPEWTYYFRDSTINNSGATGFSYETEVLAFNPKTQTVYYHFLGID